MSRIASYSRIIFSAACAAFLLAGAALMPAADSVNKKEDLLTIICSGNRRSELAPCGCAAMQDGGVQYESNYIKSLRGMATPLLLLDAGGFIDPQVSDNEFLKTKHLLKSMEKMGYGILNVGRADMGFGLDYLRETGEEQGFTFVSCNVVDPQTHLPLFAPYVIKEFPRAGGEAPLRIAVTGFAEPDDSAPDAKLDLSRLIAQADKIKAASEPAVSPTPTPRVSPKATLPEKGSWEPPSPKHYQTQARIYATPMPPSPEAERFLKGFKSVSGAQVEDRREELQEKLIRSETLFTPETSFGGTAPGGDAARERLEALKALMGSDDGAPPARPESKPAASQPASAPAESNSSTDSGVGESSSIERPRPSGREFAVADPGSALAQLMPALSAAADFVVVLAHGQPNDAEMVVRGLAGIDLFYYGHGLSDPGLSADGGMIVHRVGNRGRALGRAVVFPDENGALAATPETVSIGKSMNADPEIEGVLDDYKEETSRLLPEPPEITDYTLAGSDVCGTCHEQQHEQWEATSHSSAIEILIREKQQYNPDCLPCHTTSYRKDNGFYDIRTTPVFANVQCEVCHGPGLEHVTAMRLLEQTAHVAEDQRKIYQEAADGNLPSRAIAAALCVNCHNEEIDPKFDFEAKAQLVSH